MKNIRSMLSEQVFLFTINNNENKNCFTYNKYNICYKSRAYIKPINTSPTKQEYEIIIPKPPSEFAYTLFVGVKWNDKEYEFTSPLQTYNDNFIKSTIDLIYNE